MGFLQVKVDDFTEVVLSPAGPGPGPSATDSDSDS